MLKAIRVSSVEGKVMRTTTLQYSDVMKRPLRIATERAQGPWFDVLRGTEEVAWALAGLIDWAQKSGVVLTEHMLVSIVGGCKGLEDDQREGLFPYFAQGFGDPNDPASFRAFIRSGGTMEADGKPMITQLPAYLARLYEVYAFSTTPKTSRLHLQAATTGVGMGKYNTGFDAGQHQLAVVDEGPGKDSGWDGDVHPYLQTFHQATARCGMKPLMVLANGGGVTVTEALGALLNNIPLILIDGTGRAADEMATAIRVGTFMDYVRKHIESSGSFLTPDHGEQIGAVDLSARVHIADLRDHMTLREGVLKFKA